MKKFSTLVVALVLGITSVGITHAEEAPPPPPGVVAPVQNGLVIGGVGIPTAAVIGGGVLLAVGLGVAISNSNNNEDSGASTPTSTSTSTSTR